MSEIRCPHCNKTIVISVYRPDAPESVEELVERMRRFGADVYRDCNGGFSLSRGGGRASAAAVRAAVNAGAIVNKWPDQPKNIEYWRLA